MWLYLLLIAVPAAYITELVAPDQHVAIFVLAGAGLIPLAGLIGKSTEVLAERVGHGLGGLLNATFGNAAEIIIGLIALSKGLSEVVRASLAGSIIGNVLLVMGLSMFVGGWRYRKQTFNARIAGQYAVMLMLAVIGMGVPTLLATVGEGMQPGAAVVGTSDLHNISLGIAAILLLSYVAYIAFSVFGLRADPELAAAFSVTADHGHGIASTETEQAAETEHAATPAASKTAPDGLFGRLATLWKTTIWFPVLGLAFSTVLTAVVSELLVGSIEPLSHEIGLNPFFVGLIIIPLVGNSAEHFSAVTMSARNHTEISLAITAGSSIQIALLAAPILVFAGFLMGTPLDLNFSIFEVALFGLSAVLYTFISLDGESTWLEGFLLLAFYVIVAIGTFVTPVGLATAPVH